jgi:hypothetical protein
LKIKKTGNLPVLVLNDKHLGEGGTQVFIIYKYTIIFSPFQAILLRVCLIVPREGLEFHTLLGTHNLLVFKGAVVPREGLELST